MSKYVGRLVKLGIARETNRGVGVAPSFWIPFETFNHDDKVVKARSTGALGNLADSEAALVTTRYAEGEVTGEIRDQSFGYFLYSLLGTCSSGTIVDSSYTHSFTLEQTCQHDSLSLVVKDSNSTEMYRLAMVDELEITSALDQIVKYRASFKSKRAITAIQDGSITAENKFTKKHVGIKVAANIAGLAAATVLSIKNLVLTIKSNVKMDDVLGTAEPEDFLNQQFSIEGELTLNYEDETWKTYMTDGTYKALQIALINTDVLIGSSTRPSLTLQFPRVDFYNWSPNYALDDIVSQTISFKANRDISNSQEIIHLCQLVNTKATY